MRTSGVYAGQLELICLADILEKKISYDCGPDTTPITVAGDIHEEEVMFRFRAGAAGNGRGGHFDRVWKGKVVQVRGQGNCVFLAAATQTKCSLLKCDRKDGAPTSQTTLQMEDLEAERLRAAVCDLLEDDKWDLIPCSGTSLFA